MTHTHTHTHTHTQPHKTLEDINRNKDQWKKRLKCRALVQIKKIKY